MLCPAYAGHGWSWQCMAKPSGIVQGQSGPVEAGLASHRRSQRCRSLCGGAQHRAARLAWLGTWLWCVARPFAWLCMARLAVLVVAVSMLGVSRLRKAGAAMRGRSGARPSLAWLGWHGLADHVVALQGSAWQRKAGLAWDGLAVWCKAVLGVARLARLGLAARCWSRLGWLGSVVPGTAVLVPARLAVRGPALFRLARPRRG